MENRMRVRVIERRGVLTHREIITVVIADDHGIVRDGLKALLSKHDDIHVVGEADTGHAAIELVEQHQPHVAVLDVMMPRMDGIEAAKRIISNGTTRVLGITAKMTGPVISRAREAGILGMIAKESTFCDLVDGIRAVAQGQPYLCSRTRSVLADSYRATLHGCCSAEHALDEQERQLIALLAEGKTVGQIALEFDRSPKTIDARRRKTMQKLGIDSIAELTKYAIRLGLTTVD